MADFSIGEAFGAGFRLVGRKPGAVVTWALAILVCIFLPLMLILGSIVPLIGELITTIQREGAGTGAGQAVTNAVGDVSNAVNAADASTAQSAADAAANATTGAVNAVSGAKESVGAGRADGPDEATVQAILGIYLRMFMVMPLIALGGVVVRTVLSSAVIRAVLEPDQSSWGYMRIGMREVWVFLVTIVMGMVIGFGAMFGLIPIGLIGGLLAYSHQTIIAVVLGCLAFIVYIVAVITVSLRLSMSIPMSWDHNEFRLFEAWNFTKGHVLKMFLLVICQLLLILVLEVVAGLVFGGIAIGVIAGAHIDSAAVTAFFSQPHPNLGWQLYGLVAVFGVLGAFLGAFAQAILYAPWADVYRQLRDSGARSPAYAHAPGEAPIAPPPAAPAA